jgi:hypothetical protein
MSCEGILGQIQSPSQAITHQDDVDRPVAFVGVEGRREEDGRAILDARFLISISGRNIISTPKDVHAECRKPRSLVAQR